MLQSFHSQSCLKSRKNSIEFLLCPTRPTTNNAVTLASSRQPAEIPALISSNDSSSDTSSDTSSSPKMLPRTPTLKSLECPQAGCGRIFRRKSNLKSHLLSHSDSRPHVCSKSGCTSRFSRRHDLQRHLRNVHRVTLAKCTRCLHLFDSQEELDVHISRSHQYVSA